ncbi:sodium/potassium/calcium exchanger 4-like [Copidosoma floridanum]|uniref:sodium/potassium/calcium exchanger 4-like n=1 Tax=Copidosoma floridanum TaxID=29053 RepID=UPI0006C94CAA|nr:sodium/potassium/calcium exchanger 4-like [Copidosoma floridanum]
MEDAAMGSRFLPIHRNKNLLLVLLLLAGTLPCALEAHTLGAKSAPALPRSVENASSSQPKKSAAILEAVVEDENCSHHSIEDFPEDLFTRWERQRGAVALHVLFGLYCFLLTAYVCNDYLLPSLDCICADLRISADVAGATFLATASCFPELFINVVGTFLTESDLGIGTVVGGAVFNTFATPAVGALFAAQGIRLKWQILSRDCIIYALSVGVLVFVMWDGYVTLTESVVLLILFFSYFTLLFVNDSIARTFRRMFAHPKVEPTPPDPDAKEETVKQESDAMPFGTYKPYFHGELVTEYRNSLRKLKARSNGEAGADYLTPIPEVYKEPETIFSWPSKCTSPEKLWFVFTWPLKFVLFVTIPDSRYKRLRKFYPCTFVMCVIWIAISSYLVSWMTTVVGDTIGIPDSVMGITFLSAGGNLPEMVSIVILSRQGHGDMAMSNTLGANTLDILLCLGLPWAIRCFMTGRKVAIVSGALVYSNFSIIICVIGFYAVTALYGFILNKKVGIACLLMYALFLIGAVMMELNVFFFVNPPMC